MAISGLSNNVAIKVNGKDKNADKVGKQATKLFEELTANSTEYKDATSLKINTEKQKIVITKADGTTVTYRKKDDGTIVSVTKKDGKVIEKVLTQPAKDGNGTRTIKKEYGDDSGKATKITKTTTDGENTREVVREIKRDDQNRVIQDKRTITVNNDTANQKVVTFNYSNYSTNEKGETTREGTKTVKETANGKTTTTKHEISDTLDKNNNITNRVITKNGKKVEEITVKKDENGYSKKTIDKFDDNEKLETKITKAYNSAGDYITGSKQSYKDGEKVGSAKTLTQDIDTDYMTTTELNNLVKNMNSFIKKEVPNLFKNLLSLVTGTDKETNKILNKLNALIKIGLEREGIINENGELNEKTIKEKWDTLTDEQKDYLEEQGYDSKTGKVTTATEEADANEADAEEADADEAGGAEETDEAGGDGDGVGDEEDDGFEDPEET